MFGVRRNPDQRVAEIPRALPAVVRVLGEALPNHAVEWSRGRRSIQGRAQILRCAIGVQATARGRHRRTREHLVQHATKGPDVAADVRRASLQLFRRHVGDRPHRDAGQGDVLLHGSRRVVAGERLREGLRQAEIEQLRAVLREHDVRGLQVAMDDAGTMRRSESIGQLYRTLQRVVQRQPAVRQPLRQRLALDVLHHEHGTPLVPGKFEERAHPRMAQRGKGAGFTVEAIFCIRFVRYATRQELDGDDAVDARVTGLVDLSHAAAADRREDFVFVDAGPGGQRRRERGLAHERARSYSCRAITLPPHQLQRSERRVTAYGSGLMPQSVRDQFERQEYVVRDVALGPQTESRRRHEPKARSGAFRRRNPGDEEPNATVRKVLAVPRRPIRFYLETGRYDNVPGADLPLYEMVLDETNLMGYRHLRDVLLARGYDVTYREVGGGHDYVHWRAMLADGLLTLLGR